MLIRIPSVIQIAQRASGCCGISMTNNMIVSAARFWPTEFVSTNKGKQQNASDGK